LRETEFDPSLLVLEITESVIIEEAEHALNTLRALKELVCAWRLTTLAQVFQPCLLENLRWTFLKIDRKFVAGLGSALGETSRMHGAIQHQRC
jgi:EAL domain-containing protein (putative c-di-GMP-specific phosphodiesterase class I)